MNRVDSILSSHNEGSWKIAFADFSIAMMAVFMVLWITATLDQQQKEIVAQYFLDADKLNDLTPANELNKEPPIDEPAPVPLQVENRPPEEPAPPQPLVLTPVEVLMAKIEQSPALREFAQEVELSMHPLGLKIQIMDSINQTMFTLGDTELTGASTKILAELVPLLNDTEHRISISGHTDGRAFPEGSDTDNWTLSLNRADSARRMMVESGLQADRIAEIVGMGDTLPFDLENPNAPINRRIAIIVLNKEVDQSMMNARSGH